MNYLRTKLKRICRKLPSTQKSKIHEVWHPNKNHEVLKKQKYTTHSEEKISHSKWTQLEQMRELVETDIRTVIHTSNIILNGETLMCSPKGQE